MTAIREKQLHIVVGCSDARDVGGLAANAIESVRDRYRARGIDIEFHAIRTPGSFVTADVVDDLHRLVEAGERTQSATLHSVRYFVHIQTHGEVRVEPGPEGYSGIAALAVVPNSPFHCGMLGAAAVAVELERFILRARPTVVVRGERRVLADEDALRALLLDVYAHHGAMAGDWIGSIDDLRAHPRLQASVLRRAIEASRTLRNVDLVITAGIQDYGRSEYVRVDTGVERPTFWDDVYAELRATSGRLDSDHPELAQRVARQAPVIGLFAACDVPRARDLAAAYFERSSGRVLGAFGPNMVFTFASGSFDLPRSPFGPYTVAGFFYAVVHLGLRDFVVMGHDVAQTHRMIARLRHDPLVELIATSHDVTYHPLEAGLPPCAAGEGA